jgi:hypothetical protein
LTEKAIKIDLSHRQPANALSLIAFSRARASKRTASIEFLSGNRLDLIAIDAGMMIDLIELDLGDSSMETIYYPFAADRIP